MGSLILILFPHIILFVLIDAFAPASTPYYVALIPANTFGLGYPPLDIGAHLFHGQVATKMLNFRSWNDSYERIRQMPEAHNAVQAALAAHANAMQAAAAAGMPGPPPEACSLYFLRLSLVFPRILCCPKVTCWPCVNPA